MLLHAILEKVYLVSKMIISLLFYPNYQMPKLNWGVREFVFLFLIIQKKKTTNEKETIS